jgi:hypothetical protein
MVRSFPLICISVDEPERSLDDIVEDIRKADNTDPKARVSRFEMNASTTPSSSRSRKNVVKSLSGDILRFSSTVQKAYKFDEELGDQVTLCSIQVLSDMLRGRPRRHIMNLVSQLLESVETVEEEEVAALVK